MDTSSTDRFCDLVLSEGVAVLDDPRRLRAFLSDLYPDRPALRMGLFTAVSAGMVGRLRSAVQGDHLEAEAALLRGRLHDEHGLNEALSEWVLVTLCTSLGIDLPSGASWASGAGGSSSARAASRPSGSSGSGGGAFGIPESCWIEGTPGEPGSVFREFPHAPEMVVIPAGSFVMGSPPDEERRNEDEGPRRTVTFTQPFALGRYPVTFAEWDDRRLNGAGLYNSTACWGRGKQPAINISWYDAWDFVNGINSLVPGNPYRLPSEAEWEYGARGGTKTRFWTGKSISRSQATFHARKTEPVGSVGRPNPFGLFDVHGNVWEWVEDSYEDNYEGAPRDGRVREASGSQRVRRGGCHANSVKYLRSAGRSKVRPSTRSNLIGFRLARTLTT